MSIMDDVWGKTRRVDLRDPTSVIVDWLPLQAHSADVTAVFERLIRLPGYLRRASELCGFVLTEAHLARLAVFVFLHDIGKGNSGFQSKPFPRADQHSSAPAGHVREAVHLIADPALLRLALDRLPLLRMETWFEEGEDLQRMLIAVWSHHGIPLAVDVTALDPAASSVWKPWRWASPERTLDLFGKEIELHFAVAFEDAAPFPSSPSFQAFFAGLASLADWIGSSEEWFGFHDNGDRSRMTWARKRAADVLQAMGMDPEVPRRALLARPDGYPALFGIDVPNAAQLALADMPLVAGRGSVALLESETGSGKTEAAIAHAMRLYRLGEIDGVYFALPTRTSGVQIHGRLRKAVQRAFGEQDAPPVLLAVPGYARKDSHSPALLPEPNVRWDDDLAGGRLLARGWFGDNSKRYLAAPFAAGTIDQVLLSALRNKHAHMRAASLARSLLIIDEAHASDDYMTEITAEVVRRHVAGGGHVLLMSATLGAEAARKYLGGPVVPLDDAESLPYPLLRWRQGSTTQSRDIDAIHCESTQRRSKRVSMEISSAIDDAQAVAEAAARHARRGARVLVIRNTVGACVDVRRALDSLLPPENLFGCGVRKMHAPHHGRFAAEDRRMLDAAVEREFGKHRPLGGMVLVATQTVEQSLDIDADVLITDICPMDVLLQRIGRLHRHIRDGSVPELAGRPPGYENPLCVVLVPVSLVALTRGPAFGIGVERAYEDVRIVELTLRQIRVHPVFDLPVMNRLLVENAVHSEARRVLDSEDEAWKAHGQRIAGRGIGARATAREGLMRIDHRFGSPEQYAGWSDSSRVTSRLGASPISAVFPDGNAPMSPFGGHRIPVVAIPVWMAPKGLVERPEVDAIPTITRQDADGFSFVFGGELFDYGQDGLSKTPRGR